MPGTCLVFPGIDLPKNLGKMEPGGLIPPGIWTLADVMEYGHKHGTCPYFIVRRMVSFNSFCSLMAVIFVKMPFVDVIIYSFHYLLDPKVADQVSKELAKDAIVVFDEAHNIGRLDNTSP